ncbi:conserved hypothetical protein [Methanocella paludicola SANAE]|uniref:Uncharacterized protein n=1 Tax=Methanocella paludicola (strain DSM 17711 / JCM 13418 / NBRC 101707 / SANAE) TaxID=304371 RepID=D1YXC3_METPS|nr:hypothetical protein [Methanocella paludicola]BAI61095.1 conserved hypothetical protein [Methanocella paludicola SANAE]
MLRGMKLIFCVLLALALASQMISASCFGTGVRAYVPTVRSADAATFPFIYNGSFMVYNDGYRDGVYIIRVGVTEPTSIEWLNLSESVFTLRPGESKLVYFSLNVTNETARPGEQEFIFTPTLLATNVEPYLDDFANYISSADSFRFRLNVTGVAAASSEGTPVVFVQNNQTNFVQYSVLEDMNKVVTLLDRAIKLNVQDKALVGEPVPVSISIFQGLSSRGISLLAVSPEGSLHPISEGNVTFDRRGLWGVIVMVGDEMVLGKTVNVSAARSPLAGIDAGTILAGLSLLILLTVVPLWTLTSGRQVVDPYDDIIYRAYIIRKYMGRFDAERLRRAVRMLKDEYDGLVAKGARGKRKKAKKDIDELETLTETGL